MKTFQIPDNYFFDFSFLFDDDKTYDNTLIKYTNNEKTISPSLNEAYENPYSSAKQDNNKNIRFFKEQDKLYRHLFFTQQIEYSTIIDSYVSKLYNALSDKLMDIADYSVAEELIVKIEYDYSLDILGQIIQKIYTKHFDEQIVISGICSCLCRYDFEEVDPWGPAILAGMLNHKSELVKENAIILVENWHAVNMLPILKGLDISSEWLRNYIDGVIKDLEE